MAKSLVFFFLFLLLSPLANLNYASSSVNPESFIDRATLYSENSSMDASGVAKVFDKSLTLWSKLLEENNEETVVFSEDGQLKGELKTIDTSVYLEIEDQESGEKFYHFLEGQKSDEVVDFKKSLTKNVIDTSALHAENLKKYRDQTSQGQMGLSRENWSVDSIKTLDEVKYLYNKLRVRWEELKGEVNLTEEEFFDKYVEKNEVYIVEEGVGSAELNSIDGKYFIRVLHEKTEVSFGLGIMDEIDFESKHFKQYVARQHIDAGSTRTDGQNGRDFIFISIEDFSYNPEAELLDPASYTEFSRHRPYSAAWWKDYWRAKVKKVEIHDVKFGAVCGVLQGGIVFGTTYLVNFLMGTQFNTIEPALFTATWGLMFATIAPTFQNWTRTGPDWLRTVKYMSNGISFHLLLTAFASPNGFGAVNPTTLTGLYELGKILMASFISNRSKPNWYNFAILRERSGKSRGLFNWWGLGKKTKLKQSNIEFQLAYIPAFFLRYLDRVNFGFPTLLPAGTVGLLASIPLSEYLFLKFAESEVKKAEKAGVEAHPNIVKMAKKARAKWDFKKLFFADPKLRSRILKRFFYRLTFAKRSRQKVALELYREYPDYLKRPALLKTKGEKNIVRKKAREFKIPEAVERTCGSVIASILTRNSLAH